jgi:RNA polymerase sigma-70 factor (ECF subfamily)
MATDHQSWQQPRTGKRPESRTVESLERLTTEALGGSPAALAELLVATVPSLKRWVHGRVPSTMRGHLDTTELSHEVALLAVRALPRFRPEHSGSMTAFTRRIAMNRLRDEYRRQQRRPRQVDLDDNIAAAAPTPEDVAVARERRERCRDGLLRLRPRDRDLLYARHYEELDLTSIAQRLGISTPAAAGVAIKRAEARFRRILDCAAA